VEAFTRPNFRSKQAAIVFDYKNIGRVSVGIAKHREKTGEGIRCKVNIYSVRREERRSTRRR